MHNCQSIVYSSIGNNDERNNDDDEKNDDNDGDGDGVDDGGGGDDAGRVKARNVRYVSSSSRRRDATLRSIRFTPSYVHRVLREAGYWQQSEQDKRNARDNMHDDGEWIAGESARSSSHGE